MLSTFEQGIEPLEISLRFRFKFRKIYFWRFTSGSVFLPFDITGLVSVKIKHILNYRVEVCLSKNLKVQIWFGFMNLKPSIRFGFKNLKPSFRLMLW